MSSYLHFKNGRVVGSSHSYLGIILLVCVALAFAVTHFWLAVAVLAIVVGIPLVYAKVLNARDAHLDAQDAEQAKAQQLADVLAENDRLRAQADRKP